MTKSSSELHPSKPGAVLASQRRMAARDGLMQPVTRHTIAPMNRAFTAVIKHDEGWWIGWIEEVAGVNSQGQTREELLANLRSALREALEMNREEALKQAEDSYEEEAILV